MERRSEGFGGEEVRRKEVNGMKGAVQVLYANGNNGTQRILIERPLFRDHCDSMDKMEWQLMYCTWHLLKKHGPDLGGKSQILDSFRQNRLMFGPNLNRGQGHQISFVPDKNEHLQWNNIDSKR